MHLVHLHGKVVADALRRACGGEGVGRTEAWEREREREREEEELYTCTVRSCRTDFICSHRKMYSVCPRSSPKDSILSRIISMAFLSTGSGRTVRGSGSEVRRRYLPH
jgi:hypothetical protein